VTDLSEQKTLCSRKTQPIMGADSDTSDAVPLPLPNEMVVNMDLSSDDDDAFPNDSSHDNESNDVDGGFWRLMIPHDGNPTTLGRAIMLRTPVKWAQSALEKNLHLCGDSFKEFIELAFLFQAERPEGSSVMRLRSLNGLEFGMTMVCFSFTRHSILVLHLTSFNSCLK